MTRFSQAALKRSILAATLLLVWAGRDDGLPDAIGRQLPAGYVVLETVRGRLTGGVRDDYVVALARPGDVPDNPVGSGPATARPLLVFVRCGTAAMLSPDVTMRW